MRVINASNACEALPLGVDLLLREGDRSPSRAGDVLVAPWPVTTAYARPRQRALFSKIRDANPYFLLAELAWMLAGRDDGKFLDSFVAGFSDRFGEPGDGRIHDAYGRRWRSSMGFDQIAACVAKLKKNPMDRQVVLQMWDAPRAGGNDLSSEWRGHPCNTHVYFRARPEVEVVGASQVGGTEGAHQEQVWYLDTTVCCRSNDVVLGAYASDSVDFSGVLEYVAAFAGLNVGVYYQISNNYHAYVSELEKLARRAGLSSYDVRDASGSYLLPVFLKDDRYRNNSIQPSALVDDPETFDADVDLALKFYEQGGAGVGLSSVTNLFVRSTLIPALWSHRLYKDMKKDEAYEAASLIESKDWRVACQEWLQRRKDRIWQPGRQG